MKSLGSVVVTLAALAACGVILYEHYPFTRRIEDNPPRQRMVTTTIPRKVVESVTVDGKKVDVTVIANDTVQIPVTLTSTRELVVDQDWMNIIKRCVLIGVVGFFAFYAGFICFLWARDKLQRRETKDTEDTKNRLSELGRLGSVILLTLFGGSADFGSNANKSPQGRVSADLMPGVQAVEESSTELMPVPADETKSPAPEAEKKKEPL
jgi:hypothetical protein